MGVESHPCCALESPEFKWPHMRCYSVRLQDVPLFLLLLGVKAQGPGENQHGAAEQKQKPSRCG